jgi:hypothetical protein
MESIFRIEIKRVLRENGTKPFFATSLGFNFKNQRNYFETLRELKDFYKIQTVHKDGTSWAISPKGKKHEWQEYNAWISEDFLI